jgi:hypothetical protein
MDAHYSSGAAGFRLALCRDAASGFTRGAEFAHNPDWIVRAAKMIDSSFHATDPVHGLLARELAATAAILGGVYGNFGLIVRPHVDAPAQLPAHLLGSAVHLAVDTRRCLRGAVVCEPVQLPFAADSFMLVVAQHVMEQVEDEAGFAAELARVLAPEGIALVFGFNPFGTWRSWVMRQQQRYRTHLHLQSAHAVRGMLARECVDTLQVRFPGLLWPGAKSGSTAGAERASPLARWGSSWMLVARKRRSTLTPLRVRAAARDAAIQPRLAAGAHRECA